MAANPPTFQFENTARYSVVTLHPSLNDVQWANIERIGSDILGQLGGARVPSLLVDLSGLSYMGSAMVALVVRLWKAVNERGGRMVVVNKNEMVLEVLRLAGLSNVWTIVGDKQEAVGLLGGPAPSEGDSGGIVAVIGLLGAIAAAVLVGLQLAGVRSLDPELSRMLALAGAAAGLILGTLGASKGTGASRALGIVAIVVALAAGGVVASGRAANEPAKAVPETSAPAPAGSTTNAGASASTSPAASTIPSDPGAAIKANVEAKTEAAKSATQVPSIVPPNTGTSPAPDAPKTPEELAPTGKPAKPETPAKPEDKPAEAEQPGDAQKPGDAEKKPAPDGQAASAQPGADESSVG